MYIDLFFLVNNIMEYPATFHLEIAFVAVALTISKYLNVSYRARIRDKITIYDSIIARLKNEIAELTAKMDDADHEFYETIRFANLRRYIDKTKKKEKEKQKEKQKEKEKENAEDQF